MLKKLVKYGNSNALVLDKAILELLNIEEGSILKISTDGKSLILTPQAISKKQEIQETYTNSQANLEVMAEKMAERYPETAVEEILSSHTKVKQLLESTHQNPLFLEELADLKKQFSNTSPEECGKASLEFFKAYKALRGKHAPELLEIERNMVSWKTKEGQNLSETQIEAMQKEFSEAFKKHSKAFKAYNELETNQEYQHEQQLAAEKYKESKNSQEYIEAIEKLQQKYSPETAELRDLLKTISNKYC